jgi:hypothetical protein
MGLIFVVVCESPLIPLRSIRDRAKMFAVVGYSIRWAKIVAPRSGRPQGQGERVVVRAIMPREGVTLTRIAVNGRVRLFCERRFDLRSMIHRR